MQIDQTARQRNDYPDNHLDKNLRPHYDTHWHQASHLGCNAIGRGLNHCLMLTPKREAQAINQQAATGGWGLPLPEGSWCCQLGIGMPKLALISCIGLLVEIYTYIYMKEIQNTISSL